LLKDKYSVLSTITSIKVSKPILLYLFIAFLEGGAVLAVELLGSKMLAPYYGSSLVVWTSVIGITLISLTTGYYWGGKLASRGNLKRHLYIVLTLAAVLIGLMPITANILLRFAVNFDLYTGVLPISLMLLGPPLVFLGTVSPILIQLITSQVEDVGREAGFIYAISTIGGIITTFLFGFIFIPGWGITYPSFILAFLLFIITNIILYEKKMILIVSCATLFIFFEAAYFLSKKNTTGSKTMQVLYESEGLLGQIKVLEEYELLKNINYRRLLMNGIPQTFINNNPKDPRSLWRYVHQISMFATLKPNGSSVLLLGFGGGSVSTELSKQGHKVDAVDIDGRMLSIAKQYFFFEDSLTNFIVDDARHYIKTTGNKYDLIVLDLLKAEIHPSYLFSIQSFNDIKKIMNQDAVVIINFEGYEKGKHSIAFYSIYKTLNEAGFDTRFYYKGAKNYFTDLIFVASMEPLKEISLSKDNFNNCCQRQPYVDEFVGDPFLGLLLDTKHAELIDDDKPILDILNAKTILEWRKTMVGTIARKELDIGIQLFK